ncbi:hypothetical protein CI610_03169 [invertebrate metagenome]|uniref:GIY-YIG domain-containing protein n=1 Tax=invertebrate metagenome TaxID=1711999 RepID=A0A2H9T3X1_9ZZZZ
MSDDTVFERRCSELKSHLLARGYKSTLIDRELDKVRVLDRASLLEYKVRTPTQRVPCVVTFHPNLPSISSILHNHWRIIESSATLKRIFPEPPLLAYRRPKNVRDLVVSSKLHSSASVVTTGSFNTCSKKTCKLCPYTESTDTFKCVINNRVYHILQTLTCTSANVVYLLSCKKCKMQYVGETSTKLNIRINNHRCSIKQNRPDFPVARHFNLPSHSWKDMQVVAIDHCPTWNETKRRSRERYWITNLQTCYPRGMNER